MLSGLLFCHTTRHGLSSSLGLTSLIRMLFLAYCIYYLLLSVAINPILLLGAFFTLFWLVIIRMVV
jgi:hypothetical protein